MKKNSIDQTVILMPGWSDAFAPVLKDAVKHSRSYGLSAVLEVDVDKVVKRTNAGDFGQAVIVSGARRKGKLLGAKEVYDLLKSLGKLRKITVIDGWIWQGIPRRKMVLMNPAMLVQMVIRACT